MILESTANNIRRLNRAVWFSPMGSGLIWIAARLLAH